MNIAEELQNLGNLAYALEAEALTASGAQRETGRALLKIHAILMELTKDHKDHQAGHISWLEHRLAKHPA